MAISLCRVFSQQHLHLSLAASLRRHGHGWVCPFSRCLAWDCGLSQRLEPLSFARWLGLTVLCASRSPPTLWRLKTQPWLGLPLVGQSLATFLTSMPALDSLSVNDCGLGDAGLTPLFTAVSAHATLRYLNIVRNEMSFELAQAGCQYAVENCTSLLHLRATDSGWYGSLHAEGYVEGRRKERERVAKESKKK